MTSSATTSLYIPAALRHSTRPGSAYADSSYSESVYSEFENDQTWDDWEDDDENPQPDPQCLFCAEIFPSPTDVFRHCAQQHGFDFLKTRTGLKLDFYQCIRLINYLRKQALENSEFSLVQEFSIDGSETFLQADEYLHPVMEGDALLYAFEDIDLDADLSSYDEDGFISTISTPNGAFTNVTPTTDLEHALLSHLRTTEEQLRNLEAQFSEYKVMVKKAFMPDDLRTDRSGISNLDEESLQKNVLGVRGVEDEGNYYYNSYARNDIHESMLKDRIRTEGYRDFIYENKDVFKNKIVLDVGCGTGILSMFAARAGASKVFSVDNSDIIKKARDIVNENGLNDIITLIHGKIEEISLPVNKVDIIISEWMGYFLLYEAMLDSVLVARDRWLDPISGIMAPSRTSIFLSATDDESFRTDKLDFWEDVYGFKMTAMKKNIINEAIVEVAPASSILTDTIMLKDLPLHEIRHPQLNFVTPFTLRVTRPGSLQAFVGWFDTEFARERGTQAVKVFTTGPEGVETHWKQTVFVLSEGIEVVEGMVIKGTFHCHKNPETPRALDIEIRYQIVRPGEMDAGEGKMTVEAFSLQ